MGQHSPLKAWQLFLALSNKLRLLLVFFSPNIDGILHKTQTGADLQRKLITACLMPHGVIRGMIRELTTHFADAPLGYVWRLCHQQQTPIPSKTDLNSHLTLCVFLSLSNPNQFWLKLGGFNEDEHCSCDAVKISFSDLQPLHMELAVTWLLLMHHKIW